MLYIYQVFYIDLKHKGFTYLPYDVEIILKQTFVTKLSVNKLNVLINRRNQLNKFLTGLSR